VASRLKSRIELGQLAQLLAEQAVVPAGDLSQAVIGDHEGAGLCRAEMFEVDGRHLLAAQEIAGEQPAVAGDHLEFGVDQDRDVEAENPDAVGDLPDLLAGMPAGIPRIGPELLDRAVDDLDPRIADRQGTILVH